MGCGLARCIIYIAVLFGLLTSLNLANAQQKNIVEVQSLLKNHGYKPGPVDGFMGGQTRSAIEKFQFDVGLPVNGQINGPTLQKLKKYQVILPSILESIPSSRANKKQEVLKKINAQHNKAPSELNVNTKIAPPKAPIVMPSEILVSRENAILKKEMQNTPKKAIEKDDYTVMWIIIAIFLYVGWHVFSRRKDEVTYASLGESYSSDKVDVGNQRVGNDVSISDKNHRHDVDGAKAKLKWHPKGNLVNIAGYELKGLIYTGKPKKYKVQQSFAINPSLRVATEGYPVDQSSMGYWPNYSDIDSKARATYLEWLSSGRRNPNADVGYVFLFFYGLEFRFFKEVTTVDERAVILQEVKDLLKVYGNNGSVKNYLSKFVEFASFRVPGSFKPSPVFDRDGWETPLVVKFVVGAYVDANKNINVDWMLSWLVTHPEHYLRAPALRCFDEFKELFSNEFSLKYPEGYKLKKTKKRLKPIYEAASGEFTHELEGNWSKLPDVSQLSAPVRQMAIIAEVATEKLDKYSRFLGRNPDARGSLKAQLLLPQELHDIFGDDEVTKFSQWVNSIIKAGGLVSARKVFVKLDGVQPDNITKSKLISVADSLATIGFGLAPDPRYSLRTLKNEEPVILFEIDQAVRSLEVVSNAYRLGLMQLSLGAFVAHADGDFSQKEKEHLRAQIKDMQGLSQQEHSRLNANLEWLVAVPPDLPLLRRKLKAMNDVQSKDVRSAVVATALADGIIHTKEVVVIEKIYKAIGLDASLVYSDLHSGSDFDDLVSVKKAQIGSSGEMLPPDLPSGSINLNMEKVESIRTDTDRVSAVLGDVFSELDVEEATTIVSIADASILNGLDKKHTELVRDLIEQDHWSESDFEELSKSHKLLPSGSLEVINEWSFNLYDEVFLDAYQGIDITSEISEKIKLIFEGEYCNV